MGCEPVFICGRPCDWSGWAASPNPSVSFCPPVSRIVHNEVRRSTLRFIGLDVHRDFCDVAIYENGRVRSAGRVASSPEQLGLFAQSLCRDDHVALEATGNALSIARILDARVGGVLVADTRNVRAITHAKVKTIASTRNCWPSCWPRGCCRDVGL
jgi:hypothetical protein